MTDAEAAAQNLDIETAPDIVPEFADALALDEETRERALELARKYGGFDAEHPLSYTPRSIAAGAVYLASLEANRKRTQAEVGDATGLGTSTVGRAHRAMLEREYPDAVTDDSGANGGDDSGGVLDRFVSWLSGGEQA